MAKQKLSDEDVEKEISRYEGNEYVQLARQELRVRYRRRQYLYQLRNLEKRGKELAASGITLEILRGLCPDDDF